MNARLTVSVIAASLSFGFASSASAFDGDAAQKLFKKNDCTKCHAPDKTKKGPSLKKIAAKWNAPDKKATAEDKLIKHLTSSPKVKLDDGTEEEHKALEASKAEMTNLIQWVLSN